MDTADQEVNDGSVSYGKHKQILLFLKTIRSFLGDHRLGLADASKDVVDTLKSTAQAHPTGTIFDDDVFAAACNNVAGANKAKIIQDISHLIVPRAETLALRSKGLDTLAESDSDAWDICIPHTTTRPQPDYAVGFRQGAFTKDRLSRLSPFIGDLLAGDESFFLGTCAMFFPFLTCEVVSGDTGLDVADHKNAHSMTLAVRAVVDLFRLFKREKELDRKILAFSVSHNHRFVSIYGHYPRIGDRGTTYYRHLIKEFSIRNDDGKDRWTAHRIIKNIYHTWAPAHLESICSAVDQLPPPKLKVNPGMEMLPPPQPHIGQGAPQEHDSVSRGVQTQSKSLGGKRRRVG